MTRIPALPMPAPISSGVLFMSQFGAAACQAADFGTLVALGERACPF